MALFLGFRFDPCVHHLGSPVPSRGRLLHRPGQKSPTEGFNVCTTALGSRSTKTRGCSDAHKPVACVCPPASPRPHGERLAVHTWQRQGRYLHVPRKPCLPRPWPPVLSSQHCRCLNTSGLYVHLLPQTPRPERGPHTQSHLSDADSLVR